VERASKLRRFPSMVEKKYQRDLVGTISELHNIIKEFLIPKLKNLKNSSKKSGSRLDAIDDDLKVIFNDLQIKFADRYPERLLESLAERRGIEISEHNLDLLRAQVKQVQGIDLFVAQTGIKTQINLFIQQNVSLIVTVHNTYLKDVRTIVYNGVGKGESLALMTEKISKRTGVSKSRAKLIARDQTAKLNGDITAQRHTSLGIKKFEWSTSMDERVRFSHRAVNGKTFTYKKGATVDGVSGTIPGEPIQCRCIALPVFDI